MFRDIFENYSVVPLLLLLFFLSIFVFFCIFIENRVISLILLIGAYACTSFIAFYFEMEFIGIIILIIYVGALLVFFLFIIIILSSGISKQKDLSIEYLFIYISLIIFYICFFFLIENYFSENLLLGGGGTALLKSKDYSGESMLDIELIERSDNFFNFYFDCLEKEYINNFVNNSEDTIPESVINILGYHVYNTFLMAFIGMIFILFVSIIGVILLISSKENFGLKGLFIKNIDKQSNYRDFRFFSKFKKKKK